MFSIKNVILGIGVFFALFGIASSNIALFGFGAVIAIIAFFFADPINKAEATNVVPEPVKAPEPVPEPVKVEEVKQEVPVAPIVAPEPVLQEVKSLVIKPAAAKAQPTQPPKKRGRKPTKK